MTSTPSWTAILVLAAGTYALRLAGPLLRDRLRLPARLEALLADGAVVLLVALVALTALTDGPGFAGWARAAGLGVAGLAVLLRAPFPVVVLAAAATAAGLRLLGVG